MMSYPLRNPKSIEAGRHRRVRDLGRTGLRVRDLGLVIAKEEEVQEEAEKEVEVEVEKEEEVEKEGMKLVIPVYPTFSQAKGTILLLTFFLLAIGLPAGWFGVNQDVAKVSQSPDGAFYIMEVAEEPGFIRGWFREGGVHTYVRRIDGEDVKWYTYPDSRSLWFGGTYEDIFNGWAVEQAVKRYSVPVQVLDENR